MTDEGEPEPSLSWMKLRGEPISEPTDEDWAASWAAYTRPEASEAKGVEDAVMDDLGANASDLADDEAVASALRKSEVAAAQQAHGMRERFFNFVVRSVVGTLIATGLVMAAYVVSQWGRLAPGVMVSFYSAVVVQVIGLAYIIARYLFAPRSNSNGGEKPRG